MTLLHSSGLFGFDVGARSWEQGVCYLIRDSVKCGLFGNAGAWLGVLHWRNPALAMRLWRVVLSAQAV